ncbi:thioredoxin [Aquipluma nitroreducens]|uniref:Thioredoxin n=1 Tax=Aquipluma nitroreducens TaxID=2010828 RepID=A0A5K7SCZ5_9BACT|nr:thioredoxin domain-containing protein [Aquipluma nitroreducens]BBE19453.1 thioredoxin [Aquipluma nitroreducens]
MKHLFLTVAVVAIVFSACGNKKQEINKNTGITNSSIKTTETNSSEKLTKALFVEKVWDFTKSPNDWKYLGNKPAIIDFYADWCGPCKIASPILDEVGEEYAGKILVYKINTDQERELAQVFGITGIPAFLYIPANGKPVMMSGIGRSKEETKKMFIENIEKYLLVKK